MPVRVSDLSVSEYWKLARPFLAFLVLGLAIKIVAHWFPNDFVIGLAEALMIAGLVGLGLEFFATKLLIQKVSDELAEKLIGYRLPAQIQAQISKIVKTDIVRENYVKTYCFSDPDPKTRKIKIEAKVTFQVRNYSESAVPYTPEMDEEVFFDPEFLYLEYGIEGEPTHCLTESKLKSLIKEKHRGTSTKQVGGDKEITLQPTHVNPKAICSVIWKYRITMPEEFCDITEFRAPTIGVRLQVDRLPDDFIFITGTDVPHEEGSITWYMRGPFMNGQHVRAWWFRKRGERSGNTSDPGKRAAAAKTS